MNLQDHLKSGELFEVADLRYPCKKIVCRDGFTVSVQASRMHYSTPQNNDGPYTEVELGHPSEPVEAWMDYCDEPERPTMTVYPYVPIERVVRVLDQHGGIDWVKTMQEVEEEK